MTDEPRPNERDMPPRFATFQRRAGKLAESPERLQALLSSAAAKLGRFGGNGTLATQVRLVLGMVRDVASGEYRDVSKSSLVMLVAAVLYFVVPFDLIPDFLLGLGFIDDAAVLAYVFSRLGAELERYREWQANRETGTGETGTGETDAGETDTGETDKCV